MYAQITPEERYAIAALRRQRLSIRAIAAELGRAPSSISREIRRNRSRHDGAYRPDQACERTSGRRSRSRRNSQFTAADWRLVEKRLAKRWSPEQIAGRLRLEGTPSISHETIYAYVRRDKRRGGGLWRHLRRAAKKRRKRYRSHDSRGRLAGKRHISERPPEVESRQVPGHWEIDTIKGDSQGAHSVVTMVERMTGFTLMGKLERHRVSDTNTRVIELIRRHAGQVLTITADNARKKKDGFDAPRIPARLSARAFAPTLAIQLAEYAATLVRQKYQHWA